MKLGQGVKINTSVWNPTKSDDLVLWLAYNTNIAVSGVLVDSWRTNVAGSTKQYSQSTASYKPTFSTATATNLGVLFDGTDNYLEGDQITLTDEFVVGVKFTISDASVTNDVVTGDMDTANNFIRINDQDTIGVKTSGSQKTIDMNTTVFTDQSMNNMVVGRDSSDVLSVWLDGRKQTDTATSEGDFLIDGLGARNSGGAVTNFFAGAVFEVIVIDNQYSDELAKQVSLHLQSIII
jgi:hypothetical protein